MQKIEYTDVNKLKPCEQNPRQIKGNQFGILCKSIQDNKEYFETRPVLVNKDMVIFAGNMRWRAAKELGMKQIPVAILDVTKEKQRELMLRDNRSNGQWDWDILASFDMEELKDIGFEDDELMVNLGLGNADDVEVDEDRMVVLEVLPPEAPNLREKVSIHFKDIGNYRKVKLAIESGKITQDSLTGLL